LPTFGDGFDDIRGKESKSQDPPYVSFTQVALARDLGCVSMLTLMKCLHPGSAARHRKHKRAVKTRGRFSPIARNHDFLAISGAPFQRHAENQSRPVRPDGWCCGVMRPNNDFDLRCMNDDPLDMKADQVSRALIVWAAGVTGWNLLSGGDIRDCNPVCDAVLVGECAAYMETTGTAFSPWRAIPISSYTS